MTILDKIKENAINNPERVAIVKQGGNRVTI